MTGVPAPHVAFVNQGAMGTAILGLAVAEQALREGLEGTGIEATFRRLPTPSVAERLLALDVPGLRDADLDLHALRWHVVESVRGRRVAAAVVSDPGLVGGPVTDLHVLSHTAGLLLGRQARSRRVWLSVDATIRQWDRFGVWRPVRAWSDAALIPSNWLERRAFRYATGILAWCEWSAAGVREVCPEARVEVVHPGIDLEVWTPGPARTRAPEAGTRVLFVGGRFGEKGGDDILAALGPRLGNDVTLDVVSASDLPARDGVRQHRLQRGDPELLELYRRADIFALPSRGDTLPWTALEAMATATPMVVSAVGGLPELAGDGVRGLTVDPGDVPALRRAFETLIDDPARRLRMGAAGRAHVKAHYDVRRQGLRLAELLREPAQPQAVPAAG